MAATENRQDNGQRRDITVYINYYYLLLSKNKEETQQYKRKYENSF